LGERLFGLNQNIKLAIFPGFFMDSCSGISCFLLIAFFFVSRGLWSSNLTSNTGIGAQARILLGGHAGALGLLADARWRRRSAERLSLGLHLALAGGVQFQRVRRRGLS